MLHRENPDICRHYNDVKDARMQVRSKSLERSAGRQKPLHEQPSLRPGAGWFQQTRLTHSYRWLG